MEPRLRNTIVYGIIVSWMVFPVVCVLIATAISAIFGCTVTESSPEPCIVFGIDMGRMLHILAVMGWLGIITLPSGGIALALYTAFVMMESRIARRKNPPLPPTEGNDDDRPPILRP
jgi:hypothetical protein